LWGHYVDRCGSRNPSAFLGRFSATFESVKFKGEWLAPSSFTAKWLKRRGLDPKRIHIVGNPQPEQTQSTGTLPPNPIVLFLGRLVPNKGCDVLLRAASLLPASAQVWIAGDGPERPKLEAMAKDLGLGSKVSFLGWAPPEHVRELLVDACVLAVPSLWPEPFGLVVLEAYAAARPVVASSVGGLADLVVDGVTGRSVPPDDPATLAEALTTFLSDLPGALNAGIAGQAFSNRNFSMKTHLDRLELVYAQAVETAS
jgi:glycosyltransferase involved in cell wall biosynthesis